MSRLNVDQIYTRTGTGTPALREMPAFRVWLSTASVSLTNNVAGTVQHDTVEFDTNSFWDAVNYRYTPQIAGYYQFNWNANLAVTNATGFYNGIRKNGSDVTHNRITNTTGSIGTYRLLGSELVYLNGSTDYIDHYVIGQGSAVTLNGGQTITFLSGFLVRPD
jgi:hypothetical protein